MQKGVFGKTGLNVTPIGFGAGPIGYLETDQARVEQVVRTLLDSGINLIDTAAAYRGSEEALGKALGSRRDEVVLVSKCGQHFEDLPGNAWSGDVVSATVERSLRRLQTDHLDVMLLHSCDLEVLQRAEAVGALMKAREAGKIRFIGYSGDNEEAAYAARMPDMAVIETSVNVCDQANIAAVLPVTRKQDLGVIAKRPLANTAWRPPQQLQGIYEDYSAAYRERLGAMQINPGDLGFSGQEGWAELALRFTLSVPGVHVAIIGTTNPDNVRRNLAAAAKGPLPDNVVRAIEQAFKRGEEATGKDWPGLT